MAYWQFEDTIQFDKKTGASKPRLVAKDSSRHGNHLPLINPPQAADVIIENDVRVQLLLWKRQSAPDVHMKRVRPTSDME